jgi:hypothetical protein
MNDDKDKKEKEEDKKKKEEESRLVLPKPAESSLVDFSLPPGKKNTDKDK